MAVGQRLGLSVAETAGMNPGLFFDLVELKNREAPKEDPEDMEE